jgi:hypothetical protein
VKGIYNAQRRSHSLAVVAAIVIPAQAGTVIPAQAGTVIPAQAETVIPAQAGIQLWPGNMDSRLRGNDGGCPRACGHDGVRGADDGRLRGNGAGQTSLAKAGTGSDSRSVAA